MTDFNKTVKSYSDLFNTLDCIESYLQSQTGSPFKNMHASYLIVAILMNSDFEHYGPETLLQDALKEYKKDLVGLENSVTL